MPEDERPLSITPKNLLEEIRKRGGSIQAHAMSAELGAVDASKLAEFSGLLHDALQALQRQGLVDFTVVDGGKSWVLTEKGQEPTVAPTLYTHAQSDSWRSPT